MECGGMFRLYVNKYLKFLKCFDISLYKVVEIFIKAGLLCSVMCMFVLLNCRSTVHACLL